jgi:T4-like virus tail tube protein gp19
MPFTVNDFRSKLVFQGAKQNLFQVILPFPAVSTPSQTEQFTFMCKAASLPPEEMGVVPVPYFGRQIKVPGDRTFPEWTVTVINDETFSLRDAFETWSNAINGHFNNLRNPAAQLTAGFKVNCTVQQFGKIGDVIKEYDMIGCWPSAVTQIDLAWDANDQIEDFQVTLQYDWWEARTTV